MKEIRINVENKIASAVGSPVIVCGNSNYKITFNLDAEWGAYQEKTARFTFRRDGIDKYIDVLFSGNSCTAPILNNIERVSIGVYAGDLRTTTGAEIRCKKSILCRGGLKHEQPPEDVYNQILETVSKKLGSEGGTVTGDYYYGDNTFIHEGNLDLVEPKISEVLASEKFVETASGKVITIDSANAPLQSLKLYGKTTQSGTPTPDSPIPLVSVGDSGSFEVGVYGGNNLFDASNFQNGIGFDNDTGAKRERETYGTIKPIFVIGGKPYVISYTRNDDKLYRFFKYKEDGTYLGTFLAQKGVAFTLDNECAYINIHIGVGLSGNEMLNMGTTALPYEPCNKQTLTLPYNLLSVPVLSGGNYIDANGQRWFRDEIDLNKGVFSSRIIKKVLDGSETYTLNANGIIKGTLSGVIGNWANYTSYSTHFIYSAEKVNAHTELGYFAIDGGGGIQITTDFETVDDFKEWLQENNVTIYCIRKTPTETLLSEAELNAYRSLMTNSGTTNIISEADAEVEYYANTPNAQAIGNIHSQINKDYLKLQGVI